MSEVERIAKALQEAGLPEWVERTSVESMIDHLGDPSVRVIVVVRSDREEMLGDGSALNAVVRQIHQATYAAGSELYAYTRFLAASEAA